MSRWTQGWLPGSGTADDDGQAHRGERLGKPAEGVGSIPGFGPRLLALIIDWAPCTLVAQLATDNPAISQLALFAVLTTVSLTFFDRTPGHAAIGLRVEKLDGSRVGFSSAVIRTILLCLAVPALITDGDGRGLHDKAAQTVVVRTR